MIIIIINTKVHNTNTVLLMSIHYGRFILGTLSVKNKPVESD